MVVSTAPALGTRAYIRVRNDHLKRSVRGDSMEMNLTGKPLSNQFFRDSDPKGL